jgi:hypothetical protein
VFWAKKKSAQCRSLNFHIAEWLKPAVGAAMEHIDRISIFRREARRAVDFIGREEANDDAPPLDCRTLG